MESVRTRSEANPKRFGPPEVSGDQGAPLEYPGPRGRLLPLLLPRVARVQRDAGRAPHRAAVAGNPGSASSAPRAFGGGCVGLEDGSGCRRMTDLFARRFAGDLFAMSNLRPSDTGVEGAIIWVSTGEFGGADAQDGPRMKVLPGTTLTPESRDKAVSVRLTPASGRGRQAARHDQEAGGRVREREPRHAPRLLERGTEHARDAGRAHPRVA